MALQNKHPKWQIKDIDFVVNTRCSILSFSIFLDLQFTISEIFRLNPSLNLKNLRTVIKNSNSNMTKWLQDVLSLLAPRVNSCK